MRLVQSPTIMRARYLLNFAKPCLYDAAFFHSIKHSKIQTLTSQDWIRSFVTHVSNVPGTDELQVMVLNLRDHINHTGGILVRQLRRKDYLYMKREKQSAIITAYLQAHSLKRSEYICHIFIAIGKKI